MSNQNQAVLDLQYEVRDRFFDDQPLTIPLVGYASSHEFIPLDAEYRQFEANPVKVESRTLDGQFAVRGLWINKLRPGGEPLSKGRINKAMLNVLLDEGGDSEPVFCGVKLSAEDLTALGRTVMGEDFSPVKFLKKPSVQRAPHRIRSFSDTTAYTVPRQQYQEPGISGTLHDLVNTARSLVDDAF